MKDVIDGYISVVLDILKKNIIELKHQVSFI